MAWSVGGAEGRPATRYRLCHHHGRQQRDRHPAAVGGAGCRRLPGAGCPFPHRRRSQAAGHPAGCSRPTISTRCPCRPINSGAQKGSVPLYAPRPAVAASHRGRRTGTANGRNGNVPPSPPWPPHWRKAARIMGENARRVSALRDGWPGSCPASPTAWSTEADPPVFPASSICALKALRGNPCCCCWTPRGSRPPAPPVPPVPWDPSHVLLALGLPHEVAHGSLRLSLNEDNTEAEVDAILAAVPPVVAYLRDISPVWESVRERRTPLCYTVKK